MPLPGRSAGLLRRLTVFLGGDAAIVERVKPLLESFCSNIFHTGEVGSGNVVKLTNNMISLGSSVLIQEALAVGVKAGMDPMKLFEMWNVSSASRWSRHASPTAPTSRTKCARGK